MLGDKYSSALGARYMGLDNKPHNMFMGCYGIGVSRLMAACLETLSTETELRWPQVLATLLLMLESYKQTLKMLSIFTIFRPLSLFLPA